MNTEKQEFEYVEQKSSPTRSLLKGLFIGSLVGAGTVLLLVPQSGGQTRAEIKDGAMHLRDRASETVKDKVTQVKAKANQIKSDVQIKAVDLQEQGKHVLIRQLDRVAHAAEAGKKAIENNGVPT